MDDGKRLHIAPIAHAHINMRGVLTFDLAQHRATLLADEPAITLPRAASR